MKQQDAFNRVVEVHTPAVDRLITRYLFAEYSNSRTPLSAAEKQSLAEMGIDLGRFSGFSHPQVLALAQEQSSGADIARICDAFLLSLDHEFSRFRAPLRALSITANVPRHRFTAWRPQSGASSPCAHCGCLRHTEIDPVEAAHFMVREGTCGDDSSLVRAAWCLNWFRHAEFPKLTSASKQRFRQFLKVVNDAPPASTSSKIASLLGPVIGGNKYTRESFMETLGLAGVLYVENFPGQLQHWTRWDQRPQTGEMIAPASLWRRGNGFDSEVFQSLFPTMRLPKGLSAAQANG